MAASIQERTTATARQGRGMRVLANELHLGQGARLRGGRMITWKLKSWGRAGVAAAALSLAACGGEGGEGGRGWRRR